MAVSAKRKVKIEIGANADGMDTGIADAKRKLRTMKREEEKASRDAAREKKKKQDDRSKSAAADRSSALGFGKGIAHGMAAAAGFDLAGGLGGMFEDVFDTERELTRFGIDAKLSSDKVNQFRGELMKTSEATGVSRNSLVRGAHAYQILTGNAEGAVKSTALFADVANASGASMEDIAASAASMQQNLGIDPSQFRKGFDVLLSMGHDGSVELRDFAGELVNIAPKFKDFGDKGSLDKMTELAALAQGIRKNFANSGEMGTGFTNAMNQISKSKVAASLAGHGVDVWRIDPKSKLHVKRDFFDIMGDIKKKIPDQKILQDILGGRQVASTAIMGIMAHWDEIVKLKDEAANSDQVAKDAQQWMDSSSGRIAKAWEHIKNSVAEALTPERIEQFASALTKAADAFAKVVGFASDSFKALQWLNGGGAPGDADAKNAEQDMFLDPAMSGEKNAEENAVAHARRVALANSTDDLGTVDEVAAAKYGGLKNYQQGARLFLANEDKSSASWRADGGLKQLDQQTGANAYRLASGNAFDAKAMAGAIAQALRDIGFGNMKIPNETVAGAASRAITVRTGNHR